VLAVFFRAVRERQPQLPDRFIGGAHRFDAMASEIVWRLAHVSTGVFQCFDGFGNARMTQTFRLRRNRHYASGQQNPQNDPKEKPYGFALPAGLL